MGQSYHFETCYQFDNLEEYCWTKAYYLNHIGWFQCIPDGGGKAWKAIDAQYVNPVTQPNSCGPPCGGQHEFNPSDDDDK